jgi:hypothetical protein
MNVEMGTEAVQLLFWEYINGNVVAVHSSWWEVVKVSQILYPSAE